MEVISTEIIEANMDEIERAYRLAIEALQKEIQKVAVDANFYDLLGATYPYAEQCSRRRRALQTAIEILRREAMMTTGLMWFDDGKEDLATKITKMVQKYAQRMGVMPNICFVNPGQAVDLHEVALDGGAVVKVQGYRGIMKNNFWLGIEE